jgi:hypothetical protein
MRSTYKGTRPAFVFGENYVQSTGRQVDWDQIPNRYRQGAITVTCGANAAISATTMTLTVPVGTTLSKGQTLDFGGLKFARLGQSVVGTGAPVAGIVVDALATAIVNTDVAYVGGTGPKFVAAGTIMAQLTNGKVIPLSLVTKTYTATVAAKGTNTGNGVLTMAATPTLTGVQAGVYRVTFIEPASNLGTFVVEGPNGIVVGEGVVGTAFATQIAFTVADGSTDFVSGDEINVTIAQTDGSTCAGLIITSATEGSLTDAATGYGMLIGGVVFENLLPDAVASVITAAQKAALIGVGQGFTFETYSDTRS